MLKSAMDVAMHRTFEQWLAQYGHAWTTGDPAAVLELFTPRAEYYETPFDPPLTGHAAIHRYWADGARDAQRNVRFEAKAVSFDGTTGFAAWRAAFERVPSGNFVELDGILAAQFDARMCCEVFREWWHRRET